LNTHIHLHFNSQDTDIVARVETLEGEILERERERERERVGE
jgi:hypothetical protein